jgi:hypothetical protein
LLANRRRTDFVVICALFAMALGVRTYNLASVPPGLYVDEAANGVDILAILSGHHSIFFEANHGREPLFIYLQALFVGLLGLTPYALRLTSAVIGAATIPALYWSTVQAFHSSPLGSRAVAGWTALFVCFSYWHLHFSRLGLRAIMLPLALSLTIGFFWRAWHRLFSQERFPLPDLLFCGLCLGASQYTYVAARFMPLLLFFGAGAIAFGAPHTRDNASRSLRALGVVFGTALVIFGPLGYYILRNPANMLEHVGGVSVFAHAQSLEVVRTIIENVWKTLGMFGLKGSPISLLNPAGGPAILPLEGALAFSGAIVALWRWRSAPYLFTLAQLGIFLVPGILSDGAPHYLRNLGALPAVFLLIVIAALELARRVPGRFSRIALLLPLPLLLYGGYADLQRYFGAPWQGDKLTMEFDASFLKPARLMQSTNEPGNIWLLPVYPIVGFADASPVLTYLTGGTVPNAVLRADQHSGPKQLQQATAGYSSATLYDWSPPMPEPDGTYVLADWKGVLSFLLNKYARQINDAPEIVGYERFALSAGANYAIADRRVTVNGSFGGRVSILRAAFGRAAISGHESGADLDSHSLPSGGKIWCVLDWQANASLPNNLQTSLMLVDQQGHLAGQVDGPLVGDQYFYRDRWNPGEEASTYHILQTIPALAPGRYSLNLAVYEKDSQRRLAVVAPGSPEPARALSLGIVEITPALTEIHVVPSSLAPAATSMGQGLELLGYDAPSLSVTPGQRVVVTLYWRAKQSPLPPYQAWLTMAGDNDNLLTVTPARPIAGDYPTSLWRANEIVREWFDAQIPADATSGEHTLSVRTSDSSGQTRTFVLGTLNVSGRSRIFVPPTVQHALNLGIGAEIRLVGYDLDSISVRPGGPLLVTLYWQCVEQNANSAKVFVHVLDATGKVVSQQDAIPQQGASPTTAWLPGEFVTDQYRLELPLDAAPAGYRLEIGMYDAETEARLPIRDRLGAPLGDQLVLPEVITVQG